MAINRSFYTIESRNSEDNNHQIDDRTNRFEPANLTETEDKTDDCSNDLKTDNHEELGSEDTPFIAISKRIRLAERLQCVEVFIYKKYCCERPSDRDNNTRNDSKKDLPNKMSLYF